jgi:hypothetical protein
MVSPVGGTKSCAADSSLQDGPMREHERWEIRRSAGWVSDCQDPLRPECRVLDGTLLDPSSSPQVRRSAGRRAFFRTFSITLRDPFRRDRRGATGLEVVLGEVPVDAAGEQRGSAGKISADQARALCGMSGSLWYSWAA